MFIVFEGIDGSGTTTQARMLADRLNKEGVKAIATGEPTANEIGKLTKKILQHKVKANPETLQMLFCADRMEHILSEIKPAIENGTIVISDRFFWSTIAFGSLECDEMWLRNMCESFINPDFTFYINLDPKIALQRIESRGEKELFEKEETLKKVDLNFQKLIKEKYKTDNVVIIDGTQSVNKICDQAYSIVREKLA